MSRKTFLVSRPDHDDRSSCVRGARALSGLIKGQHNQRNALSRERLTTVIARLDDAALLLPANDSWTVAETLAHLAFWDESCLERWRLYPRSGFAAEFADAQIDVVNAAATPAWRLLPPWDAADLAIRAASAIDAWIAAAPSATITAAIDAGHGYLVDRSLHRLVHLPEIEAALAARS